MKKIIGFLLIIISIIMIIISIFSILGSTKNVLSKNYNSIINKLEIKELDLITVKKNKKYNIESTIDDKLLDKQIIIKGNIITDESSTKGELNVDEKEYTFNYMNNNLYDKIKDKGYYVTNNYSSDSLFSSTLIKEMAKVIYNNLSKYKIKDNEIILYNEELDAILKDINNNDYYKLSSSKIKIFINNLLETNNKSLKYINGDNNVELIISSDNNVLYDINIDIKDSLKIVVKDSIKEIYVLDIRNNIIEIDQKVDILEKIKYRYEFNNNELKEKIEKIMIIDEDGVGEGEQTEEKYTPYKEATYKINNNIIEVSEVYYSIISSDNSKEEYNVNMKLSISDNNEKISPITDTKHIEDESYDVRIEFEELYKYLNLVQCKIKKS